MLPVTFLIISMLDIQSNKMGH